MGTIARALIATTAVLGWLSLPQTAMAEVIYACYKLNKGNLRYVQAEGLCLKSEMELSWDDGSAIGDAIADLQDRLHALEASVEAISARLACVSDESDSTNVYFEGCNVHVRNGLSRTDSINGVGNLIVGYDAPRSGGGTKRGSHNLIVGDEHDYSSYGGFVAGLQNTITGASASVSGGTRNRASGGSASICGGSSNTASGDEASVTGGSFNEALGEGSSVSGGVGNATTGLYSTVSGGLVNVATGEAASVSGGQSNRASGEVASISGGAGNEASGEYSSVSGGRANTASGEGSSILGGDMRATSTDFDTIPALP